MTSTSTTIASRGSSRGSAPSSSRASTRIRRSSSCCSSGDGRLAATSGWRGSRAFASGSRPIEWTGDGTATSCMRADIIRRIIGAYDDPIVRAYCWARFWVLRQRFLDEIGQYLPESGPVLDVGCGFGLFSLYYAATGPGRFVRGVDVNGRRIAMARRAAARLTIENVAYEGADAPHFKRAGQCVAPSLPRTRPPLPPAPLAPSLWRPSRGPRP